jgi:nucleoid-associated protein YgaU
MIRYSSTQITSRWDGKRVYKTTIYPTISPQDSDLQVVSQDGDYLDSLALKYYSDPTLYWIIALANHLGKGRLSVPPGIILRIPIDTSTILGQFSKLNSD